MNIIKFSNNKIYLRVLNGAIAAIFLINIIYTYKHQKLSILSILLCVIALIMALYQDDWTFNFKNQTIKIRIGLIFLAYKRSIKFSAVQELQKSVFTKGYKNTEYTRLSIILKSGEKKIVLVEKTSLVEKAITDWALCTKYFSEEDAQS